MHARVHGATSSGSGTLSSSMHRGSARHGRLGNEGGAFDSADTGSPRRRGGNLGRITRHVLRRRNSVARIAKVEAERKRAKLEQEITSAVLYQTVRSRIESLVERRDEMLAKEKAGLLGERATLERKVETEATREQEEYEKARGALRHSRKE